MALDDCVLLYLLLSHIINPLKGSFFIPLTGAIFETGAYGVPSKSQKSFICGGVRQTITLKSPGKGAPPSTPSWGLQVDSLSHPTTDE